MAKQPKIKDVSITICKISRESRTYCILGLTPLILNCLSNKAKAELLMPRGRKTQADKATSLKHDPIAEFNAAPHKLDDPQAPTLLALPTTAFKGAMRSATKDMPGVSGAEIGRLCYINGELLSVWGRPMLFMSAVRNSDINHTPDIRTRAIVPQWAAYVTVSYTIPNLNASSVDNLLGAAGQTIGVGDWRPEKGSGTFGMFELVDESNKEFQRITKVGRKQQEEAMLEAMPYNRESEELLTWFTSELKVRGKSEMTAAGKIGKKDKTEKKSSVRPRKSTNSNGIGAQV